MTKEAEKDFNYTIAKVIIMTQINLESLEDLKRFNVNYKRNLKYHANGLIKELEKRLPQYDLAFAEAEDFMLFTQQKIEFIVPLIASWNLDELASIADYLVAYRIDPDATLESLKKIRSHEED